MESAATAAMAGISTSRPPLAQIMLRCVWLLRLAVLGCLPTFALTAEKDQPKQLRFRFLQLLDQFAQVLFVLVKRNGLAPID